jgi:sugar/nucleoside kinase (ribokinase family)
MTNVDHTKRPCLRGHFVGLCTLDIEYVVRDFPIPGHKIAAISQEITAGGPATNAAVTFSFLGGAAFLSSALGCHPLASLALTDLNENRVQLNDIAPQHSTAPTISSIIVHAQSGERTAVSANAAIYSIRNEIDRTKFPSADIVLVDGHHIALCIEAAKAARQQGVTVVLDGGSWKSGLEELIPFVDVAICSDDFVLPERGQGDTIVYLGDSGISKIAVTRGGKSILWVSEQGQGELSVREIQPKDTLGAGDVLHGAFCWAYASGYEFKDALKFAAEAATEKCLHFGTRAWMMSSRLEDYLKSRKQAAD